MKLTPDQAVSVAKMVGYYAYENGTREDLNKHALELYNALINYHSDLKQHMSYMDELLEE